MSKSKNIYSNYRYTGRHYENKKEILLFYVVILHCCPIDPGVDSLPCSGNNFNIFEPGFSSFSRKRDYGFTKILCAGYDRLIRKCVYEDDESFPPEDDMTVWMAANSQSRKVKEIRNN